MLAVSRLLNGTVTPSDALPCPAGRRDACRGAVLRRGDPVIVPEDSREFLVWFDQQRAVVLDGHPSGRSFAGLRVQFKAVTIDTGEYDGKYGDC